MPVWEAWHCNPTCMSLSARMRRRTGIGVSKTSRLWGRISSREAPDMGHGPLGMEHSPLLGALQCHLYILPCLRLSLLGCQASAHQPLWHASAAPTVYPIRVRIRFRLPSVAGSMWSLLHSVAPFHKNSPFTQIEEFGSALAHSIGRDPITWPS